MRPTLRTRKRARSARAVSGIAGWTRLTRPLSRSRSGFSSVRRHCRPDLWARARARHQNVLVRVVVLAGAVMDLATGMAALDLDRRVPDVEAAAEPALEIPDHMLGVAERALLEHDMDAERHVL